MKKLLAVILILALILPAAALADLIEGIWYAYTELSDDQGYEMHIFRFDADGSFLSSTYTIDKQGVTKVKDYKLIGLWSNKDDHYYINIGLNGVQELTIEDGTFFLPMTDEIAIRVRKLEPVDYAFDIRRLT